jgi:hypothetical protein
MTFTALIIVCALLSVLFVFSSARRFRRRQLLAGTAHGGTALILLLLCVSVLLLGMTLRRYQRLSYEQLAGEVQFTRTGDRAFDAHLSYPGGEQESYALKGDEWQVDARVLKWHAFANLVGFDSAYRLERISGRYTDIKDEQTQPRTVYELSPPERVDPWSLVRRYHSYIPWVDALYGNATFLPMADGALFEIKVSQSGLVSRPLNQAARVAVGNWH